MKNIRNSLMKVQGTTLENVLLFKPFIHEDFRGQFVELYKDDTYTKAIKEKTGRLIKFVEDTFSTSFKHVLRGFHGDDKTWKLVNCLKGRVYVVVVNCDKKNENFGKWESFTLSDKNRLQVLIPKKYGTAHLVLSDGAIFHYKLSEHYNPATLKQFTYRFDDPHFNVWWPIKNPILSQRDEIEKNLKNL